MTGVLHGYSKVPMPDEQPRASKNYRVLLDGEEVTKGELTLTVRPRDGMLCTLDGKVVKPVKLVYDETSGEIVEIHLEEVRE